MLRGRGWIVWLVALVASLVATGFMHHEVKRLRRELEEAKRTAASSADGESGSAGADGQGGPGERRRGRGNALGLLGALGRMNRGDDGKATEGDRGGEDRPRRPRIKDILGRQPGETDEQYRARVLPLLSVGLTQVRDHFSEQRRQFEEAAGVSDDQRKEMDKAFGDAYQELVGHANRAIASGDLTPYRRNTQGILGFVGGAVPIVDGLNGRLDQILTPAQQQTLEESGFDVLEYLGGTAPWEKLNPPPPEPEKK